MPSRASTAPLVSTSNSIDRRFYLCLVAAAALPFIALLSLFLFDVPIGQPSFVHRYSPFFLVRALRTLPALGMGLIGVTILYRAFVRERSGLGSGTRAAGLACYLCLAAWTFVAPPSFVGQNAFNLLSPSHDGAFVLEARRIESVRGYLGRDFYTQLQKSPEEMRGRRILSNPPGTTVIAVAIRRLVEGSEGLRGALIRIFGLHELDDENQRAEVAAALLFGMFMTVAWGLAIVPAYWLSRLWLPEAASCCVAFAAVFNPATVTFAPGKDPAQLLTVLLIAAGWLATYAGRRPIFASVAGAAFALGLMIGLVHVWILAIVAGATLLHALAGRQGLRRWIAGCCVTCVVSAVLVATIAYALLDWNILRTVFRVGVRYGEIQLPIITDPFYWTLVGLPMFLLFVGPLFWVKVVAVRERTTDDVARLGRWLLWMTAAVMTYSYFFANNSETPRLWMPFIPPLLIGMVLRRLRFREDSLQNRRLMMVLLGLQLLLTVASWSLMDVRESEWRLDTGRMWD